MRTRFSIGRCCCTPAGVSIPVGMSTAAVIGYDLVGDVEEMLDPIYLNDINTSDLFRLNTLYWYDQFSAFNKWRGDGILMAFPGVENATYSSAIMRLPLGRGFSIQPPAPEAMHDYDIYVLPSASSTLTFNGQSVSRSNLLGPVPWTLDRPLITAQSEGRTHDSPDIAILVNQVSGRSASKYVLALLHPSGTLDNISESSNVPYIGINEDYGLRQMLLTQ